jgi:hypothetical protein
MSRPFIVTALLLVSAFTTEVVQRPAAEIRLGKQAQALGMRCIVPGGPICLIPPTPMGSPCFCNGLVGYVAP